MNRVRAAVLVPAMVVFGGLVGSPVMSAATTAPAAAPVGFCMIDPINGGCLSAPCPKPFYCPEAMADTTAIAAKL